MKPLIVSPAPHVHNSDSVAKNMYSVLSVTTGLCNSTLFFGLGALIVSLTAMVSCVIFEYLIQRFILKIKNYYKRFCLY